MKKGKKLLIMTLSFAMAASIATPALASDIGRALSDIAEFAQDLTGAVEDVFSLKTSSDKHIAYVNNYVGMNAANIGYTSLSGDRRDSLGSSNIELIFVTSDGTYVGADNEEDLKNWKVVSQNPAPNTEVKLEFLKDSDGNEYNSLVDWTSLDKIELAVVPVGSDESGPLLTELNVTTDKYTTYVRDYVGKNLASVGYTSLAGDYRDTYGETSIQLVIAADDGSYIDFGEDKSVLQNYVITGQNIPANTALTMTFYTDSEGNEYSWTDYQSVESITLTVHALS